jgi:hypothetical protein
MGISFATLQFLDPLWSLCPSADLSDHCRHKSKAGCLKPSESIRTGFAIISRKNLTLAQIKGRSHAGKETGRGCKE